MGSRYTLKDFGYKTFKKIMKGKNWVGRVVTHADGGFVGIINLEGRSASFQAPTEIDAFEGVVAQHLGFPSAQALRASNKQAISSTRAVRANARHAAKEMLKGNFGPLDEMLGLKK